MHYVYCPVCGRKLEEKNAGDDGKVPYCENCGRYWFDSFSTCVIILVADEQHEIALLRQEYLSDRYSSLVSGYMSPGESAEDAAIREVREELGIPVEKPELVGTYWFGTREMLMIGFIDRVKKCEFRLSEEVDSASWVPAEEVPKYLFPKAPGNAAFALYEYYQLRYAL